MSNRNLKFALIKTQVLIPKHLSMERQYSLVVKNTEPGANQLASRPISVNSLYDVGKFFSVSKFLICKMGLIAVIPTSSGG